MWRYVNRGKDLFKMTLGKNVLVTAVVFFFRSSPEIKNKNTHFFFTMDPKRIIEMSLKVLYAG